MSRFTPPRSGSRNQKTRTEKLSQFINFEYFRRFLRELTEEITTLEEAVDAVEAIGGEVKKSDLKVNLDALPREEGSLYWATDLAKLFYDDESTLVEVGTGGGGTSLEKWVTIQIYDSQIKNMATSPVTLVSAIPGVVLWPTQAIAKFVHNGTNPSPEYIVGPEPASSMLRVKTGSSQHLTDNGFTITNSPSQYFILERINNQYSFENTPIEIEITGSINVTGGDEDNVLEIILAYVEIDA